MRLRLLALATLATLPAGCGCDRPGGLSVDLRSNFVPGIEFDAVRTEVWGGDNRSPVLSHEAAMRWGDPVEDGVRIAEAPLLEPGRYTVTGTLLRAGSAIAQRSVIVSFRNATVVTLLVTRDCFNVLCPDDLTCLSGICVPQDCLDGSAFDGCPTSRCEEDGDCPDFDIECTEALCLEGGCHPFPNHDECGEAEWCNPDEGCRIFPDWPHDAGADAGGGDAGTPAGPCMPGECDDGNPCTDDVCDPMVGCVFSPNAEICDDGMFCNGPDRCSGGTCSVSSGDPCPTTSCNELRDTCECTSDSQCPGETPGPWGDCSFPDTCASTGTRSRTVTRWTCGAGMCVPATRLETGSCARANRDGLSCGSSTCGAWDACSWPGPCDESGQQARTCTDRVCAGGTCTDSVRTETRACSRSTAGVACGAGSYCDGWSACNYTDECDEDASQSRTCHDFTCTGGACRDAPSMESRACTRSTENTRCGSNPTYCGSVTRCHVCRSGSCVVNTPHYDADCNPSCGSANMLCGAAGRCCPAGSCTPVGGGPFADCATCCAEGVCF